MKYILYNLQAGHGTNEEKLRTVEAAYPEGCVLVNMAEIESYRSFFEGLDEGDSIVLCGGDGVRHEYKKVWLAPAMNGRYYGGGMMPTPEQNRLSEDGKLSLMVWHGAGKIKTLLAFPSLFKGEHFKQKKMVDVLSGHEVTVEFDSPCALQIDGETITGVTKYTAHSWKK